MAEVLRVAAPVQLRPLRERPDPVVLRGITLAPRYGVRVAVERSISPDLEALDTDRQPSEALSASV